MGYDFTMRRRPEAREQGHDPRWRMNNTAMGLITELLDRRGVIDWDEPGPQAGSKPASGDWEDEAELFDAAHRRWHAEQEGRANATDPAALLVPGVKFSTNDGWIIFSAESRRIASALREATKDDAEAVKFERKTRSRRGRVTLPSSGVTRPSRTSSRSHRTSPRYCERAAEHGGFRVS